MKMKEITCKEMSDCTKYCPLFSRFRLCMSIKLENKLGEVITTDEFEELSNTTKEFLKKKLEEEVK